MRLKQEVNLMWKFVRARRAPHQPPRQHPPAPSLTNQSARLEWPRWGTVSLLLQTELQRNSTLLKGRNILQGREINRNLDFQLAGLERVRIRKIRTWSSSGSDWRAVRWGKQAPSPWVTVPDPPPDRLDYFPWIVYLLLNHLYIWELSVHTYRQVSGDCLCLLYMCCTHELF